MTADELSQTIAAYGEGLEAELPLLRKLAQLADQERDAGNREDLDLVSRVSAERESVMAALLAVEAGIRDHRPVLAAHREDAAGLPGFARVVSLHRTASELVTVILGADQETVRRLQDAAAARRAATQAIENGGQTLSAYRRVIAPPLDRPNLVDRRG